MAAITAPSLDAILAARGVVVVPGLLHWLGLDPDGQPADGCGDEALEDFCQRISEPAP